MFNYFDEPYTIPGPLLRCDGGDVVAYGRQRLSRPHHSDRRKKGQRAAAQRRAKGKRRKR